MNMSGPILSPTGSGAAPRLRYRPPAGPGGDCAAAATTTANVEDVLPPQPGLAVVHFRADDCSACDGVASILAQLVDGCAGRLPLTEVDVHAQPGLADRYNIRLTPTILLIRDGAVVDRVVGAATQAPAAEPDRRESAPARRLTARPPGGRVPRLMVDLRPRPLYGPGMGLCRP